MKKFFLKLSSFAVPFTFMSTLYLSADPIAADAKSSAVAPQQMPEIAHKYGIIDMQRIILNVNEGKEARATLEKEIKAKEESFHKKKEELDKLNKEWQEQAPLLSEQASKKKQQEFQEKFVELRNAEMAFQNEMKQKEGQATQRIAMNVTGLVDGFARAQNLDMVFEVNSSGLVYLKNPVDLTDRVIKKYNETKFDSVSKKAISTGKNSAKSDSKKF